MPYYLFNRCPEKAIPHIEALARSLGLIEKKGIPPLRDWEGDAFNRENEYGRFLLLVYNPNSKVPLLVQTDEPTTHKQEDVRKVLKTLIDICKPETISANVTDQTNDLYDLGEFN